MDTIEAKSKKIMVEAIKKAMWSRKLTLLCAFIETGLDPICIAMRIDGAAFVDGAGVGPFSGYAQAQDLPADCLGSLMEAVGNFNPADFDIEFFGQAPDATWLAGGKPPKKVCAPPSPVVDRKEDLSAVLAAVKKNGRHLLSNWGPLKVRIPTPVGVAQIDFATMHDWRSVWEMQALVDIDTEQGVIPAGAPLIGLLCGAHAICAEPKNPGHSYLVSLDQISLAPHELAVVGKNPAILVNSGPQKAFAAITGGPAPAAGAKRKL